MSSRLTRAADSGFRPSDPALRAIDPGSVGWPRIHFRTVDSTNAQARAFAAAGAPHGTLVTAGVQSAGRGRQGRAWVAPAGTSVLMSLVMRNPGRLLSLAAGVAVAETAERFGADDVTVKWPNDVWIAGAKVAGILVEGRPQEAWAVLGIGLNVREASVPPDLVGRATCLGGDDVEAVLSTLLDRLGVWSSADEPTVLAGLRSRDALLGAQIAWTGTEGERTGTGGGIDADGRLVVDTASGRVALNAGEVHLTLSAPSPRAWQHEPT